MSGIKSIIQLPLDWLTPNPWNPNQMDDEQYGKALNSIREFGFVDPVTVRELGNDTYQIIDGEHRWRAAQPADSTTSWSSTSGPCPIRWRRN
jgi:ParB/RepB/Spo0J family partition protein